MSRVYGIQITGLIRQTYTPEELITALNSDKLPDELLEAMEQYGVENLITLRPGTTQKIAPGYRVQKVRTDVGDATC